MYICVYLYMYMYVYIYIYVHAVSAFRGKALLGIKCINLFFCACVYYFGEGDSVQLDKDTNSGEKG